MELSAFFKHLDQHLVSYRVDRVRDATMVVVPIPGERWEVEFMDEGGIEVERFRSDGEIGDEAWLRDLMSRLD